MSEQSELEDAGMIEGVFWSRVEHRVTDRKLLRQEACLSLTFLTGAVVFRLAKLEVSKLRMERVFNFNAKRD